MRFKYNRDVGQDNIIAAIERMRDERTETPCSIASNLSHNE